LIIGSKDSTNTTVMKIIGEENIIVFGPDYEESQKLIKSTSSQ